jgi:hypothetical protein
MYVLNQPMLIKIVKIALHLSFIIAAIFFIISS